MNQSTNQMTQTENKEKKAASRWAKSTIKVDDTTMVIAYPEEK